MILSRLKRLFKKQYFIHKTAVIWGRDNLYLHKDAEIWEHVIIRARTARVEIGENTQVGPFSVIFSGQDGVSIGANCMIAPHTVIAAGTHDFRQVRKPMRFAGDCSKGPVVIGDDVWIGANCTIADGVHICSGAVVGANSVVTKNVAPYDIVAGCPAKKIGNRLERYGRSQ